MDKEPNKVPVRLQRDVFHEHHGIETDMTGLRAWICWSDTNEYSIWEITYESQDNPDAQLPYYRVNWRVSNIDSDSYETNEWQLLADCADFESAVLHAETHADRHLRGMD